MNVTADSLVRSGLVKIVDAMSPVEMGVSPAGMDMTSSVEHAIQGSWMQLQSCVHVPLGGSGGSDVWIVNSSSLAGVGLMEMEVTTLGRS